jgi:tetratricopeptide (TPR) repeat protein
MSSSFDRALVLYHQSRYDLADRELRQQLASEPDDAPSHALLALCLTENRKYSEATHEAEQAVRLAPEMAFTHYALAHVLHTRQCLREAEAAIHSAIALDPDDAEFAALLAAIRYNQRRWRDALESAERGLALDPQHIGCTNLRAMALVKLGRKREAGATIESALAKDPENALTHANQGWALLDQGQHVRGLEHFREALRLDPEIEWARVGIVEALKAKHLLYRWMLFYFLWMAKLSRKAQWAVLLGLVFGQRVLSDISRNSPRYAPLIEPVLLLLFGFLILSWIADPLFNLLLRLNRFGRMALSPEQIVDSNWLAACLLAALLALAAYLATPGSSPARERLGEVAFEFAFLVLPVAGWRRCSPGWPRRIMGYVVLCLAVLGPGMVFLSFLATTRVQILQIVSLHDNFVRGVILSTWACVVLGQVRVAQ